MRKFFGLPMPTETFPVIAATAAACGLVAFHMGRCVPY